MSKNFSQTGIGQSVEYSDGGARVKDNTGVIEIRDNADAVFANCRGADPVIADDLTTKRYVDAIAVGEVNTYRTLIRSVLRCLVSRNSRPMYRAASRI